MSYSGGELCQADGHSLESETLEIFQSCLVEKGCGGQHDEVGSQEINEM